MMLHLPDYEPEERPHGKLTPQRWTKRMAESAPLLDQVLVPDLTNVALSYLEPTVTTTEIKVPKSGIIHDFKAYIPTQEFLPGSMIMSVRDKACVESGGVVLNTTDPAEGERSTVVDFPFVVTTAKIRSFRPARAIGKEIIVTLMELDPPLRPSASYVDPDEYLETYFETQ